MTANRAGFRILLIALALSGAASLANQVVWQRMLKLQFGGAEASSSALIVMIFLAGIGLGAHYGGKLAHQVRNPFASFAKVELSIACCAILIALLGSLNLAGSTAALIGFADRIGLPLLALYGLMSALVLGVPTFLMGVTIPLASEAMQRQLAIDEGKHIGVLTSANTIGAVVGSLGAAYWLLPYYGQAKALYFSFALNAIAAGISWRLARLSSAAQLDVGTADPTTSDWTQTWNRDLSGLIAGCLALAYEMLVFRAMALCFTPKPHTFALALAMFLLFWSAGNYLSTKVRIPLRYSVLSLPLLFLLFSPAYEIVRIQQTSALTGALIFCAPVLFFGLIYGALITSDNRHFGRDVGRFCAWNTVGSCLGVALFFALFSRLPISTSSMVLLALSLVLSILHADVAARTGELLRPRASIRLAISGVIAVLALGFGALSSSKGSFENPRLKVWEYPSPNGMIEVDPSGNLIWDGLWHSKLESGTSYVGTANWRLAATPMLAHVGTIDDALVIGFGSGITVHTLSTAPEIKQIRFYDINRQIERLMKDAESVAINPLNEPRVQGYFAEARSSLVRDPQKYDLITQQPTYISQSGSSFLLSQEYFRLLQSRLKANGMVTVYANAMDSAAQGKLIANTLQSVFTTVYSCHAGYMYLASDGQMQMPEAKSRVLDGSTFGSDLMLSAQIPMQDARALTGSQRDVCRPLPPKPASATVITDDWPLVEYPEIAEKLIQ